MEDTKPKAFVFVLMPFDPAFKDTYEVGIRPACKDAGAYCERVDEQIFEENILERVYNQIAKADVIVAEMTGRNPNVFYEVGYAHALNKRVILLTRSADDIPFDLKHYPHVVYEGSIATLKSELEARVRWCVENPKESLSNADVDLEFIVNGVQLIDKPVISAGSRLQPILTISVHNPTSRIIRGDRFDLALKLSFARIVNAKGIRSVAVQPDGSIVANLVKLGSMFPGSWENVDVEFDVWDDADGPRLPECSLRMLTEVGTKDHPFLLD